MSATNIVYNATTEIRTRTASCLRKARESRDELKELIAILQTGISGNGSDSSQYTQAALIGGYTDAANAYASWLELNSLYAKLSCPGGQSVSDVSPATDQCCAKHGV